MTRFGWGFLGVLIVALLLAASMVRIVPVGGPVPPVVPPTQITPALAPPVAPAVVPGATSRLPPLPTGLMLPVQDFDRFRLTPNFGDPRDNGARRHQGLDMMAERGTPVVAVTDGTIEKLYLSRSGGGITLYLRSADRNWTYYYAHLGGYAPGMAEGLAVKAGDPLGFVGDTGNAAPGGHHLHFEVHAMAPGERWHEGQAVDPYPLLAGPPGGG